MRGLVEEAQHEIEEQDGKGPIMDLVIVAGMQRIEHYEIAAYGTDIALAEALGEREVVELLSQTLAEEKETDLKLTQVTKQHIMPAAMQEGRERRRTFRFQKEGLKQEGCIGMSETGVPEASSEGAGGRLYDEAGRPLRSTQSGQQTEDLVRFVQEHPVATALGALALGYVLGKLV